VVAFVSAVLVDILGILAVVWYAKRRPVGAPLTWGEAIAGSTYVFFLMFWSYGVVPHQWLTYAGNELAWRTDKQLWGPSIFGRPIFHTYLRFTIDYEKLRDLIAVLIYGIFLGLHIGMWSWWQNRGKARPAELPTSTYGRPLVRKA
jgi:hypothetical protein